VHGPGKQQAGLGQARLKKQCSHVSCKLLDFWLDFPGPGKTWKTNLVLKIPVEIKAEFSGKSWQMKILDS